MKANRASLGCCLALLAVSLVTGCATASGEKGSVSNSQNSPWLDPQVEADYDDMTTAQKIGYCVWWPFLEIGEVFCGVPK